MLLILLVSSILINYIDRGALSVAIPSIEREFQLTATQKGLLLSVFFWTYALMQLPAGWLIDRVNVKWAYAGGYFIWTVATAMTGFVDGFVALLAARLLLGLGESAAYPAISRLVVANYPESKRGMVNSLIDAGTKLGPALSILAGGLLIDRFGWRALFIGLGVGGLVWLIPWFRYVPSEQPDHDQTTGSKTTTRNYGPSFKSVLLNRSVWGTSLGMFSLGYVWAFMLTWLPTYMIDVHGLNLKETAFLAALPFLAMAASSVFWGWASDTLIARGSSPTRSRKTIALGGFTVAAGLLIANAYAETTTTCVTLLVLASSALGMFTANVWAMTQTMAGPAAGTWTGVQNCVGNMGGVLSPLVTGWTVDRTGAYQTAFFGAAVVMLLGVAAYLLMVGPIREIDWQQE